VHPHVATLQRVSNPPTLAEFLRSKRESLVPEAVGLRNGDRRRVPGLRREEVALLAGISVEYYLRLEQGRDRHPSDQVLNSISQALQLDVDAHAYMLQLARPQRPFRRRRGGEKVSPHLESMIDQMSVPAIVQSMISGNLASNAAAQALSPFFAPGVNTFRAAFLEPEMRELYRDWEDMTAKAVANARTMIGHLTDDPRVAELIGELSMKSERFRTLWAKHDVRVKGEGLTRLRHPQERHGGPLARPPGRYARCAHSEPACELSD
jgi:transcriptional regulator with XRE-family HTH domain